MLRLVLASLPLLAEALSITPTRAVHAPRPVRRAPGPACDAAADDQKVYNSGAKCHLLETESVGYVKSVMQNKGQDNDSTFATLCDQPPEDDPTVTCFMVPDNWDSEVPHDQGEWLCMRSPESAPSEARADDSY